MSTTIPIPDDVCTPTLFASRCLRVGATGCIEWQGNIDVRGYGRVKRNGRLYFAHRVALSLAGIELVHGMVVDHLCRNPRCVNTDHLQQVLHRVNTSRGIGPTASKIRARDRGQCVNGHLIKEVGTHRQRGGATCAQCGRDRVARYKARISLAAKVRAA